MRRTLIENLTFRAALVAALAAAGAAPAFAHEGAGDGLFPGGPLPALAETAPAGTGWSLFESPSALRLELGPLAAPATRRLNLVQMDGAPPPGMDGPPPAAEEASVTEKWWFWAAVGALVVGTVAVLVLTTRAPKAPDSQLGDMEFMP